MIWGMCAKSLARLTALIVPPLCAACGSSTAPDRWICRRCDADLRSMPVPTRRPLALAAFNYDGPARQLVSALKFGGAVATAREMAALTAERLDLGFDSQTLIVPAPAHPVHRRRRGYNQSLLLARELARLSGGRPLECLHRRRGGRPQSEQNRAGRLALDRSSIVLDERVLGRALADSSSAGRTNVVVCDDVTTTGVTLEACVQAFRDSRHAEGFDLGRAVVFAAA